MRSNPLPTNCCRGYFNAIRTRVVIGRLRRSSLIVSFLFASLTTLNAVVVWIDTDVCLGSPFRDKDDAFALLLACRSSNLRVAGISTTYGNASLDQATTSAEKFVACWKNQASPPPVFPGARSRKDLEHETEATRGLANALRRERGILYVALGPLTNLATFQKLHPALARRISRLIFLGGELPGHPLRFGTRHPIRIHDANVFKDANAVRSVFQTNIPITLVPIVTASNLMLTEADLDSIGRSSELGKLLRDRSRFWFWYWTKFVGTEGAPIFDAAAILAAIDQQMMTLGQGYATVDSAGRLIIQSRKSPRGCVRLK